MPVAIGAGLDCDEVLDCDVRVEWVDVALLSAAGLRVDVERLFCALAGVGLRVEAFTGFFFAGTEFLVEDDWVSLRGIGEVIIAHMVLSTRPRVLWSFCIYNHHDETGADPLSEGYQHAEKVDRLSLKHANPKGLMLKLRILLVVIVTAMLACSRLGILPSATPLPLPTELATTPQPEGSQLGGLEATFVSVVSVDGFQDERCYKLYRFYPDGLVLYADFACLEAAPSAENWSEINRWFQRENPDLPRGDYYLDNSRLWVRVVSYDPIHETTDLRLFQGEYCNDKIVLQEPAALYYTGVPSELMQPVLEYVRLPTSGVENTPSGTCHVAGFSVIYRPSVVLAGGQAEYQVQTDPGETCTLQYTAPDGTIREGQGTGRITADNQGVCSWTWELGETKGDGIVTVTIGQITQGFGIEVR
jgi:hypothetical protein